MAEGFNATQRELEILELRKENQRLKDALAEQEAVLDRADAHTAGLMKSISHLETRLKAAEYAADVNWKGWQQEIERSSQVGKEP